MGTLVASGLTGSYATLGGRHVDVDSSGNVWCMLHNLASTRMEFWYSTDGGSSFTENTSLRTTVAANAADHGHAFYIAHNLNGEQVAVWQTSGSSTSAGYYCRAFSTSSTTWTSRNWGSGTHWVNGIAAMYVSGDTFGTGYPICVLYWAHSSSTSSQYIYSSRITTAWSVDGNSDTMTGASGVERFAVDFEHTGDGRTATVSGDSRPYLMSTFFGGSATTFNQWSWVVSASPTYRDEPNRVLDANGGTTTDPVAGVCDGTRYITAFINNDSDTVIQWFERDIADTTTTERTPTALSDGAVTNLAIRRDADNNTILYAVGTTSDDIKKLVYDRTGNSFGTWETLETTNAVANSLSVQAGYQSADGSAYYCWTHYNGSTYDVYVGLDGAVTNKGVPWAGLML